MHEAWQCRLSIHAQLCSYSLLSSPRGAKVGAMLPSDSIEGYSSKTLSLSDFVWAAWPPAEAGARYRKVPIEDTRVIIFYISLLAPTVCVLQNSW